MIDIAGELSARHKLGFDDYTSAIRNLERLDFSSDLVEPLVRLPGFRNVLLHEYVGFDLDRAVRALHELEPVRDPRPILNRCQPLTLDGHTCALRL